MELIRYPHSASLSHASCLTIGNFDGVHIGHQALIKKTVEEARKSGCQSVVVSMHPLPVQYFSHKEAIAILTNFKHKYLLLKDLGVDVFCQLNFNEKLANMSPADFVQQILFDGLKAQYILIGDDFKFGANREGDFDMLKLLTEESGVQVEKHSSILLNQQRVSSTAIRNALSQADFSLAKQMLGRNFNLQGRVVHGQKLGRDLGYPTINLSLKAGGFPLHGIYVVEIIIGHEKYQAVASVGYNPSVGGNAKRVEVYVLDFDQQVYGQCVEVLFYKKLRNEVEFDNLEKLIAAIENDVRETREYFADL